MSQLALPMRLAEASTFESFVSGRNALAVASVRQLAAGEGPPAVWLWGPSGSGRTHLLQAACAAAAADGRRAGYLPLGELEALGPGVLEGTAAAALVCLDDLGRVAGRPDWEAALFALYHELQDQGHRLLATADAPPPAAGLALPDLRSRLGAAAVFRLIPLDDAGRQEALMRRARARGLELPPETARFLMRRLPRDAHSLFGFLDRLDQASLVAQRRLTVPFVRALLARDAGGAG